MLIFIIRVTIDLYTSCASHMAAAPRAAIANWLVTPLAAIIKHRILHTMNEDLLHMI